MMSRTYFVLLLMPLFCLGLASYAEGCAGCWAGYGSGDERYNKPLADLRKIYEKDGRDALPYIRKALSTSTDPLVMRRAAGYIVELKDADSLPLLNDMVLMLTKRVAFGKFGYGTYEFQGRMAVAHALANFGSQEELANRIWGKYDKLDMNRKTEVLYILNALKDPKLTERSLEILERQEDHQLMFGALDALAIGGNGQALPVLKERVEVWSNLGTGGGDSQNPDAPLIHYSALRIKAEQTILTLEEREKVSGT
jgi:hypothetical protein